MTSMQRVRAVIEGQRADRAPVSFWHHFPTGQVHGAAAVAAHIRHLEEYDLDFLKVMNDNGYPHSVPIQNVRDLDSIGALRGDEEPFARQLDLLRDLKGALRGRVPMASTIFNAWTVLRHLVRPPTGHLPPEMDAHRDVPSQIIRGFLEADERRVTAALGTIGKNLASLAARCLTAGADGIFLSVRDDWLGWEGNDDAYRRLVRPTDLGILNGAAGGWFNVLHVCGKAVDFGAFAEYPVHVINWADRAAGPPIAQVKDWVKPAICAGVNNLSTLAEGSGEDCRREVHDALLQAGGRAIMIAPGCTYDPARVPKDNLRAIREAVRDW